MSARSVKGRRNLSLNLKFTLADLKEVRAAWARRHPEIKPSDPPLDLKTELRAYLSIPIFYALYEIVEMQDKAELQNHAKTAGKLAKVIADLRTINDVVSLLLPLSDAKLKKLSAMKKRNKKTVS